MTTEGQHLQPPNESEHQRTKHLAVETKVMNDFDHHLAMYEGALSTSLA